MVVRIMSLAGVKHRPSGSFGVINLLAPQDLPTVSSLLQLRYTFLHSGTNIPIVVHRTVRRP